MNHSNDSRPRRRQLRPAPDILEDRMVLSAGEGSTFAIMPGTVAGPGVVSSLQFKIDPSLFTSPKKDGRIVVGIDITPGRFHRRPPPPLPHSSPKSSPSRTHPGTSFTWSTRATARRS